MNLLRDAWFLTGQDLRYNLRRRETLVWAFAMPVVFFYFIGTIMSGSYEDPAIADKIAVYVPDDAGFLADQVVRRLETVDYQVVRLNNRADLAKWQRHVDIPSGFMASVLAGEPVKIDFTRTGTAAAADYDRARLGRASTAVVSDLFVLNSQKHAITPEALTALTSRPSVLKLVVKPAGTRKETPTGFEQSVPGSLVFFILMTLLTNGVTLTIEREQGILRRLASSPMSREAVVLGKWGARIALGAVQIGFAILTGTILFHVRWGAHLWAVVAVLLAYASLAAALGMVLGNFGRTQRQVIMVGATLSNFLASLGGCWWPIEITPKWCQSLAHFIPTGITMDALHQLMSFGAPPSAVIWQGAILLAGALVTGYVLARGFRFQ